MTQEMQDVNDALSMVGLRLFDVSEDIDMSGQEIPLTHLICVKADRKESKSPYRPLRILKSGNRMIVFWTDGTKTIVKRADDEADSDYAAFTAALGIKVYGSNSALKRLVASTETQKSKKKEGKL